MLRIKNKLELKHFQLIQARTQGNSEEPLPWWATVNCFERFRRQISPPTSFGITKNRKVLKAFPCYKSKF